MEEIMFDPSVDSNNKAVKRKAELYKETKKVKDKECESFPNYDVVSKCLTFVSIVHQHSSQMIKNIGNVFEELAEIPECKVLLIFISCFHKKLKIHFDFGKESHSDIDPKEDQVLNSYFTYQFNHHFGYRNVIYLKYIEEESRRNEMLGMLTRELCQFVLLQLYNNKSKPYRKSHENELYFNKVAIFIQEDNSNEEIINQVFKSHHQHAELIARVPQICALYKENNDKLKKLKENLSELFKYYEDVVMVDLMEEISIMRFFDTVMTNNYFCKIISDLNGFRLILKRDKLDQLEELLGGNYNSKVISTNVPHLSLIVLDKIVRENGVYPILIYWEFLNYDSLDLIKKSFKFKRKFCAIISCRGARYQEIVETIKMFDEHVEDQIFFVVENTKFLDSALDLKTFDFEWNDLTDGSKEVLMSREVDFQGFDVKINEILTEDLSALELIPLNDLVKEKCLSIGYSLKFYEVPVHFERKFLLLTQNEVYTEFTNDDLLKLHEKNRVILLADEGGSGKSTEFKMIAKTLKNTYKNFWIMYIDLKLHTNQYRKNIVELNNDIKDADELSKFLGVTILKLEGFEWRIFHERFMKNQFIILVDGFDEISPTSENFVLELMKEILVKTKINLWVSSRPHLIIILTKVLKPITVKFKPFTEKESKDFIKKMLDHKEFGIKEHLKISTKVTNLFTSLREPIDNPLMMRLITEIFEGDDDDKVGTLKTMNLYEVYERHFRKMFQNCIGKGPEYLKFIEGTYKNAVIVDILQRSAFLKYFKKIYFGDKTYISDLVNTLIDINFRNIEPLPTEQILRIGILCDNGFGDFNFIHRTYAEYFIADFILEKIFHKNENLEGFSICVQILEILIMHDEFDVVLKFLDSGLKSFEDFDEAFFSKSVFSKTFNDKPYLEILTSRGYENIITVVLKKLEQNFKEMFLKQSNVLYLAAKYRTLKFNETLWHNISTSLSIDEIKNTIRNPFQNILQYAVKNIEVEVFESYLKVFKSFCKTEFKGCITLKGDENSVIHFAAEFCDLKFNTILCAYVEGLLLANEIKSCFGDPQNNILEKSVKNNSMEVFEFYFQFIKKHLSEEDMKNLMISKENKTNVFFYAAGCCNIKLNKFIFRQIEEILSPEDRKKMLENHILKYSKMNKETEVFKYHLEMLSSEERNGSRSNTSKDILKSPSMDRIFQIVSKHVERKKDRHLSVSEKRRIAVEKLRKMQMTLKKVSQRKEINDEITNLKFKIDKI